MTMMNAPASAALAQAMPNAIRFMRTGDAPTSRSANGSCATATTARPMKVFFRNSSSTSSMSNAPTNGTASRSGSAIGAEIPRRRDVGRVDVAEVHAEQHDQDDLREEHQPEEKGQSAHRVVAAAFEEMMIDAVEQRAGAIEIPASTAVPPGADRCGKCG